MKRKYIFLAVIVLLVIAITSCEIADLLEGLGSNVYVTTGAIKPTATSGAKIENLFKPDGFEDFDVEGLKNSLMEDLASPAKAAEIKEKMKTPLDEDTDIASFLPDNLKDFIDDVNDGDIEDVLGEFITTEGDLVALIILADALDSLIDEEGEPIDNWDDVEVSDLIDSLSSSLGVAAEVSEGLGNFIKDQIEDMDDIDDEAMDMLKKIFPNLFS
ncbi:MAG: hypothetical protein ACOX0W_03150 [Sphaerochaetaceae bacterium]